MICSKKIIRDGTNQLERHSDFLKEGFVNIDERSHEELLNFLYQLSSNFSYYNLNNLVTGNWEPILEELSEIKNIDEIDSQELVPHIGLLVTLTKLYKHAQNELNKITNKHLEYYYQDVLQITRKDAKPDHVQLVLSLAKNTYLEEFLVKAGTAFDGGKDSNNRPLIYESNSDAIISRAAISQIKSLFLDQENGRTKVIAAPIANSLDGIGTALDENKPFWPPFGKSQSNLAIEEQGMINASIGFAISNSVLLLNEGDRTINVLITFLPNSEFNYFTDISNNFKIFYSGAEEWIEPSYYSSKLNPPSLELPVWSLSLTIKISPIQPAFTFYNSEILEEPFATDGPLLKVLLKEDSLSYDTLKQLSVDTIEIEVEANGMKNHILQNNTGVLNSDSPFSPFGIRPSLNDSFYIGNSEIFQKKLDHLELDLLWQDIPSASFSDHYEQYGINVNAFGNNNFEARISMLLNKNWDEVLIYREPLFDLSDASLPLNITFSESQFNIGTNYVSQPTKEDLVKFTNATERGFIKMDLIGPTSPFKAFGHNEFVPLYTQQAIALATDDGNGDPPVLPNQPYTPTIKELSLSYKASASFKVDEQSSFNSIYQLGPFGFRPIDINYNREIVPNITEEGAMIIGLEGFSPPQTLNLLFDIEEGTANQSVILPEENISWYYLSNNRWILLTPEEVLSDGTVGFKKSGIISMVLPKDASNSNSILPSELYWIKAGISNGAEGANMVKAIYTNAVNAVLKIGDENYDLHLNNSLDTETISSLIHRKKEIKTVFQPLKSSDGFASESPDIYNARISERLRHKNRSVNVWDYERLILENFPSIFKVKCLPHTSPTSNSDAGAITLIVVSNLRNKDVANPFQPSTNQLTLEAVANYIQQYNSPFIKTYVEIPKYETILVDAKIGFHEGFDPGYYSNLLNEELKQFLSPWAFEEGIDIEIGGAIYKSAILQFMERRAYVDYVVDFNLYHRGSGFVAPGISELEIDLDFVVAKSVSPGISEMTIGETYIVGSDVNVACANSPKSILVSVDQHRITALRPDEYACSGVNALGIGFMSINLDLVVEE